MGALSLADRKLSSASLWCRQCSGAPGPRRASSSSFYKIKKAVKRRGGKKRKKERKRVSIDRSSKPDLHTFIRILVSWSSSIASSSSFERMDCSLATSFEDMELRLLVASQQSLLRAVLPFATYFGDRPIQSNFSTVNGSETFISMNVFVDLCTKLLRNEEMSTECIAIWQPFRC